MSATRIVAIQAMCVAFAFSRIAAARDVDATDVTTSGLRGSITHVQGSDTNGTLGSVSFGTSHVGHGYEAPFTIRVVNTGSIGGGARGVEGGFANAVAGGLRAPLGKQHGLFIRGGIEGSVFGNAYLWDSFLELPQFHLGYQWLVPRSVVDVAATTGYVLVGRHHTGHSGRRRLDGSPEVGAIATVHVGTIDLRASYTRIFPRSDGRPVDWLNGAFCGFAAPMVMCTDIRYELADVFVGERAQSSRVSFVGLTFGLVLHEKKPKPKPKK